MRGLYSSITCAVALSCLLLASQSARAESAAVEIQGVAASDPGKKEQTIPASLAQYRAILKASVFSTFADVGSKTVSSAVGKKSSATVGGYGVDVLLVKADGGKGKIEVTINKADGKPIAEPTTRTVTRGQPFSMEVGSPKAPTILIFTLKGTE